MNEKSRIINMISEHKISAEEGARLLAALDGKDIKSNKPKKIYFRIIEEGSDKPKLNIALPLGLAKIGLSLIPNNGKIDATIGNTNFDLSQIKWNDIVEMASSGEEGELFYLEIEGESDNNLIITISVE